MKSCRHTQLNLPFPLNSIFFLKERFQKAKKIANANKLSNGRSNYKKPIVNRPYSSRTFPESTRNLTLFLKCTFVFNIILEVAGHVIQFHDLETMEKYCSISFGLALKLCPRVTVTRYQWLMFFLQLINCSSVPYLSKSSSLSL